ncbi:hypothetical protein V8C86DRAFT_1430973 [Haematococcus lacustris]
MSATQPSSKSAVWGSLKELIDDDKSGGMHPVSREHGEHQEPGSVKSPTSDMAGREKSLDWRSFMNNVMHDDEDADSAAYPSAAQHHRPSTTKSLVAELQEEQAYHAEGLHELNNLVSEAGAAGKPALRGVLKGAADNRAAGSPLISKHGNAYGPTETQQFEIKMPSLDTGEWETVVHQVVWKVGRHFGFQAFNSNPKTQNLSMAEYVPASIFVASDHIISLLCKAGYVRRGPSAKDTDDERFAKALFELHTNIFYSYEQQWTKLVNLSWRTYAAQQFLDSYSYSDPRVIHGLLCELGLWFLIYSESSSMRHTPELMWFLYWCMNHSDIMLDFWHKDLPPLEPACRERRIELRNLHQHRIRDVQLQLQIYPRRVRPEDCGRVSSISARLQEMPDVEPADYALLADLIAFGDGGFYCDRIVTPIFDVFAYEVDHLGTLGIDVAHRIGYDDFNETMNVKEIVQDTVAALRVKPEQLQSATANEAWTALTNLGFAKLQSVGGFQASIAAEFWHTKVFVKTYRERRTWAAMYRAYFRVWCVHLVAYHFLQVLAFMGWDWRYLSMTLVTHACLKALERICNWFMTSEPPEPLNTTLSKVFSTQGKYRMSQAGIRAVQRLNKVAEENTDVARSAQMFVGHQTVIKRRKHRLEGTPLHGIWGLWEWIVLAALMLVWYVLQFYRTPLRPYAREWWGVFAGLYVFLHFLHWCLTLRDGYMVSLTHMLKLPAIFRASTLRGDATCWLSAPMHMKWKLLFLNGLFWLLVFAMKLPFDYFVIAKPVVVPLRVVLYRHWLSCDGGASKWYPTELGNTGKYPFPCLGGDWLLLAGRVAPFMVIIFMDTALFYQIAITIFGLLRGMFKLDLGVLTSWDEVTKEFYRAPARWWHKCMSELGNDNQLAQLKQSMFVEDSATGHVTQVSDGLMFKKAVLTPEEILGKKVHFNGRGKSSAGGSMSGDAAQRSGPSGVIDRMRALVQDATHSDKPERKTAMLPSSSNRTRVAISEKKRDEEAQKRDERHKEDEAKAQAHKAAIMAGKGHLIDKEVMGISQSGSMAPSVAATDGEEVQQQAAGIKGIFNRFVHSDAGEGDAVDKMAADAAKLKKSKANTGPTPSPAGRQHKVALSVSQAPKSGRTRPVTAAVSAAPSRAASAAPSRAASEWGGGYDGDSDALEVESVAGSGFGGHLGDRRQLAGGSNAASKADGKVSSILGKILSRKAEQMDEVDKMAADARRAALQKKEAAPGTSGQMAASAYPAAPLMTGTPMPSSLKTNSPSSGSSGRKKVSLSAVAPEEDNRPSSSRASGGARMPAVLLAASDRPPPTASSPAAAAAPSGPVAEAWGPLRPTANTSPEIVAAPPTTLSERHAAGRSRFSRSGGQSGPLAESLLPSQEVELSSSRQHGSTWADLPTAQHTSLYWRRTSSSSLTSDSSGSAAPLMAAPQATLESASQRKQRLRAVRKVPGKLLAMNAGPASLWWLGQALQNAETVDEPPTAAGSNQHDGSSVHVTVPAAQPLGEGVEDARPGLGPLPPLVSSPHATASTSARGHLESELDDLFGKPIDSRTNSMTQEEARPLPHTTPATPGPAVQPALALPHLLVPGSPQDMPSPIVKKAS